MCVPLPQAKYANVREVLQEQMETLEAQLATALTEAQHAKDQHQKVSLITPPRCPLHALSCGWSGAGAGHQAGHCPHQDPAPEGVLYPNDRLPNLKLGAVPH